MAFNFGNNPAPSGTPGFSFGQPATTTPATASTGFSFGAAAPAGGLAQSLATSAAPTPSFGLGAFSATPSSQPAALNLGGFSLTATSAAPSLGAPAPSLGSAAPALGATSLVGATSAAPSGFSLGSTATSKPSLFGGVGLNLTGTPAATVAPSLSFGSPAPAAATAAPAPAATTISSGLSLNFGGASLAPAITAATTTATAPALGMSSFGATPTLSLNLSKPATTAPTLPAATGVPSIGAGLFGAKTSQDQSASATAATTTTTAAVSSTMPKLTYATLEAEINKWAYQLEEQENIFIHQATQVNAWDRLLLESGDKIANLNSAMEALKMEQHKLDLELDYIASQERELEDSIGPIEAMVESMQLADPERQQTYEMAESLDAQTKQMANDLKKIITHLNIINKEQDENNPVVQIGRILNAHMNSLLWIHQTASASQTQMDEASKMIDILKKELVDHSSLMK